MKILLVGAGYVGRYLLANWQKGTDRFIISTTSQEKVSTLEKLPHVEKVVLNSVEETLEECEAVIICVAPTKGASYEATYLRTAKIFQTILTKRSKPLSVLYTSSTSVYGGQNHEWIDEQTVPNPRSEEAKILIETEQTLLNCANDKHSICILRLGGIYGPNRGLESRAQRLSGKRMPGSGSQPTNHSHVEDITRAIEFCLKQHSQGIFNLVSDAHPTRETLYKELCEGQNLPPPIWDNEMPQQHGSNSRVSNQKIKDLGFVFHHPFLIGKFS